MRFLPRRLKSIWLLQDDRGRLQGGAWLTREGALQWASARSLNQVRGLSMPRLEPLEVTVAPRPSPERACHECGHPPSSHRVKRNPDLQLTVRVLPEGSERLKIEPGGRFESYEYVLLCSCEYPGCSCISQMSETKPPRHPVRQLWDLFPIPLEATLAPEGGSDGRGSLQAGAVPR